MLPVLLAAGVISEASGAATGPFDVPSVRLATAARVQGSAMLGNAIPSGAAQWQQPFDPADHLPFGFSFNELLDEGETITTMERIAVSSAGAALGVMIDLAGGTAPYIDQDSKRRIQLWFSVDAGMQSGAAFDASGTQVAISFRVLTSKSRRFKRSGVLTVRQQ